MSEPTRANPPITCPDWRDNEIARLRIALLKSFRERAELLKSFRENEALREALVQAGQFIDMHDGGVPSAARDVLRLIRAALAPRHEGGEEE